MNTKAGAPPFVAEPPPPFTVRSAEGLAAVRPIDFWRDASASAEAFERVRYTAGVILGDKLAQARKAAKMTRETVAARLRVHENTVGKIERGDTVPDALQLAQFAAMYSKPMARLLGGDVGVDEASEPAKSVEAVEHGDYIFVPLFDVHASAGHGTFESSEQVEAMRPFTTAYIRQHLGIRHNRIGMVRVMGTSAEPEIHSGDIVMLDRNDTSVVVEGHHLVRIDGALLMKILQRRPGSRIRVASRNPEYEPFDVVLADNVPDFEVLGRVRWAGVTFR